MSDSPDALSVILQRLRLSAGLFTDATFCGSWAVDTSGRRMATFHLVQRGDCWLQQDNGSAVRLRPGDFVLFPRDSRHLITGSEEPPEGVVVNEIPPLDEQQPGTHMLCGYFEFQSRAAWPILDSLPDALVLDLAESAVGASKDLLNLLVGEALAERPGRSAVIDQLVTVLFVHALRVHLAAGGSAGLLAALTDPMLGEVFRQLHAAPEAPWSVERLAELAGMSRASFASRFRRLVGDTPMSYVTRWRMQVAVDLLTSSSRSVAQIAEVVGYQSEAAFRNAFRSVVGTPPGTIRRAALEVTPAA